MQCNGCNNHDLPPLAIRAWNYLASSAAWVVAGLPATEEAEFERRKAICETCPRLIRQPRLLCTECGCPISDKAARATESCPLGQW